MFGASDFFVLDRMAQNLDDDTMEKVIMMNSVIMMITMVNKMTMMTIQGVL